MNEKEYIEGLRKELNNRVSLGADQIMSRIEKENDEPARVIRHKKFHADIPAVAACAVLAFCITASAMYLDAGRKNDMQEFSSECRLYTTSSYTTSFYTTKKTMNTECHLYTTSSYTTSVSPVNNPSTSTSFSPQNTVVSPISDINSRKPAVTDTSNFSGIVSETEKNAGVTDSDKCSETENSEMVSVTETEYSGIGEIITQGTEVTEGDETGRVSEITEGDESDGEVLPEGIVLDSPPAGSTKLYDSLENVIKSYGDKVAVTPIIYDDINRIRTAFVITEDCRCFCIRETGAKTVTMKDGTFPPSEKINEAKAPIYSCSLFNKLSIEGENIYSINLAHNDTVAYDILMSDSNVVSVGETPIVYTSRFFLNGIEFKNAEEFNNKESYEKFYNEYSALNLIETVEDDWGYRMQGFYCNIENTPETFEALKKLCESGNYNLCQGCPVPIDEFTSSVTNLYTSDSVNAPVGDIIQTKQ